MRTIDAPGRTGLGRETVDYILGLALETLADDGQDEYRRRARSTFDTLAATERGRLSDDGGPPIAPRARLHADALADN